MIQWMAGLLIASVVRSAPESAELANENSCIIPPAVIFFVNGMRVGLPSAQADARIFFDQMQSALKNTDVSYRLIYNPTHGLLWDLLELQSQKLTELALTNRLWRSVHLIESGRIDQLSDLERLAVKRFLEWTTAVPRSAIEAGASVLSAGRRLVLTAHSQGSLMINELANSLLSSGYDRSLIGLVAVATPAAFVANSGAYVSLSSDGVIHLLAPLLIGRDPLPANTDNDTPTPGWFDHGFVRYYLRGSPAGPKAIEAVRAAVEQYPIDSTISAACISWFRRANLDRLAGRSGCELACQAAPLSGGDAMNEFECADRCAELCECRAGASKRRR